MVARATSAAPIYFDSVDINGKNFVDGGFGCNNPSVEAIFEVGQIYRQNSKNKKQSQHKDDEEIENPIDLLLSIGSGTRQPRQFPIGKGLRRTSAWLREVSRKISDTESTHALVQEMYKTMHTPSSYYRFNVGEGVGHVPLDEWKITGRIGKEKTNKTLAYIEAETFKYLDQAEIQASVLSCAQKLVRLRRWRN